jgi:UDP-N-acetylmuramate dehydrogenase
LGAVETTCPTLLSELTTLRLGGAAGTLVEARDEPALVAAVREADRNGEPLLVLAGGSNVVVADAGFPGTVVRVATRGVVRTEESDGRVGLEVQAGEPWDPLVEACVREGLAGVECLSGIPGSVGATPIQNVGAYGQEVSETIRSVRVLDRERDVVEDLPAAACGFTYRSSAFKRTPGRWVVLRVTVVLERSPLSAPVRYAELARRLGVALGERAPLADVRAAVLALRRGKGMVIDPGDPDSVSAGSFFTNPVLDAAAFAALERRAAERLGDGARPPAFPEPDGRVKTSAAWLIERAGFRRGDGDPRGIAISSKHTLALTNRGAGSTADLVALAREIAGGVRAAFGVDLVPEPVFVGHAWEPA